MTRMTAEDRKAEIVSVVLRLAYQVGPDRLTMQAVADAVGLTQPAIFRHFPTKQALWVAVAETLARSMTAAWDHALVPGGAAQDRVVALILGQLALIEAHPAIPAILNSRELQVDNADLRAVFRDLMQRFQGLLAQEVTRACAAGQFRGDLVPGDAVVLLISVVQGVALRWALENRSFALVPEGGRLIGAQMALFKAPQTQGILQ